MMAMIRLTKEYDGQPCYIRADSIVHMTEGKLNEQRQTWIEYGSGDDDIAAVRETADSIERALRVLLHDTRSYDTVVAEAHSRLQQYPRDEELSDG